MIIGMAAAQGALAPLFIDKLRKAGGCEEPLSREACLQADGYLFTGVPSSADAGMAGHWAARTPDGSTGALVEGCFYNRQELIRRLAIPAGEAAGVSCARMLLLLYEKTGEDCLSLLNGKYALVIADRTAEKIIAATDRMGEAPLYYHEDGRRCMISTSLAAIQRLRAPDNELNMEALFRFLAFSYNPGPETFLKNVYRLGTGETLTFRRGACSISRYWKPAFAPVFTGSPDQCKDTLVGMIGDAVALRMADPGRTGVLLSGGIDSSAVAAFAARSDPAIRCFSYRCPESSYDESEHARRMARYAGAPHEVAAFTEDRTEEIRAIVARMDQPFCDIGVEVATVLAGALARQTSSCLLSGDGGDELFGGHPVYIADRAGPVIDRLPSAVRRFLSGLSGAIPDVSEKKSLPVKAKRFLYSLRYPPALGTHRWRVLFDAETLAGLLDRDHGHDLTDAMLFGPVIRINREAGAADRLSASLYSDYATTVPATLDRLRLLAPMGLESRPPLLDYRLVDFCAGLPSRFKIRGPAGAKHIFKQALRGIVPDDILFRKDKLGNSVPLKNWIRRPGRTRELLRDVLSSQRLQKRGFWDPQQVNRMIQEHQAGRVNHSHRLWALVVLELWLTHHMDGKS
ncbi:MAG: asparagine synthetase B family protein [Thermodesulfobacteriota bacterium]